MEAVVDPFHTFIQVISRYRSDVHHLRGSASPEAVHAACEVLEREIPQELASFLSRWNGAVLFRGALRLRSASELAPASDDHPHVVLFADGPKEDDVWAWAENGDEGFVYGRWENEVLHPLHTGLEPWLMAQTHLLDTRVTESVSMLDRLLESDPEGPFLLVEKAAERIAQGDPAAAMPFLRAATDIAPHLYIAWQRLGDVLVANHADDALRAYRRAFENLRLPTPWPTNGDDAIELLESIEDLYARGDERLERLLNAFLVQRVVDVTSAQGLKVFEAAVMTYARVFLARSERAEARNVLIEALERSHTFGYVGSLSELRLTLARVETQLGHHDDAELRLRPLLQGAERESRARSLIALGRIVVPRQEPWAEEILNEATSLASTPEQRLAIRVLYIQRHLLQGRLDAARDALEYAPTNGAINADPELDVEIAILRGDLARLDNDLAGATRQYKHAGQRLDGLDLPELRLRLTLRRGDLALRAGDPPTATQAYQVAANGFDELGLPLREAWGRLRLGTLGDKRALAKARRLFREAELAPGVAAADATETQPAPETPWHIERATEHARLRAEAQRARPPYQRADADRPERRLGAHQSAIASYGLEVVEQLTERIRDGARKLEAAPSRPGDPRIAEYIAAVDLLAHHPSYEAATILLEQLFAGRAKGLAARGLQGAITRSPNIALVDALLDAVESGTEPVAVTRAAEILGWRREQAALPHLQRLVQEDKPINVRRAAIMALGRLGAKETVDDIARALEVPQLAEDAAVALLLLGDRRGVDFHGQVLSRGENTKTGVAGEIVGKYGGPDYLLLLLAAIERNRDECLGAIQALGYLGDPRAVAKLIEATGASSPRTRVVASHSLEILTGHAESIEEPQLRTRWERWWREHSHDFNDGVRYRSGRMMAPALLIERLGDDDFTTRRASYDELVITSGIDLPFDADGPWRVQLTHRHAWTEWWNAHRDSLPVGRWLFHGEIVG